MFRIDWARSGWLFLPHVSPLVFVRAKDFPSRKTGHLALKITHRDDFLLLEGGQENNKVRTTHAYSHSLVISTVEYTSSLGLVPVASPSPVLFNEVSQKYHRENWVGDVTTTRSVTYDRVCVPFSDGENSEVPSRVIVPVVSFHNLHLWSSPPLMGDEPRMMYVPLARVNILDANVQSVLGSPRIVFNTRRVHVLATLLPPLVPVDFSSLRNSGF